MEPTIYKPSIYKGAGIYKTGAGGGGGGNTLEFKRIIPIQNKNTAPVYVDKNGYIGGYLPQYIFKHAGAYEQSALVIDGDFSSSGLGQVIFLEYEIIGDKEYPIMTNNGITFMAENLDYKFHELAVGHGSGSGNQYFAFYYNNDEQKFGYNGAKYGLLYNYDATFKIEELIGNGWRVPSGTDIQNFISSGLDFLFPKQYDISTNVSVNVGSKGFGLPMSGYENGSGSSEQFGGIGDYFYTYVKGSSKPWNNVNYNGTIGGAANGWRCYSLRLCKDA